MLRVAPVTLIGKDVRLEPLTLEHWDGLWNAAQDERIWTYMTSNIRTKEDMLRFIQTALDNQAKGTELPFTIIDQRNNQVIGSTRFLNISPKDSGLEIGFTWLTPSVWKTAANTECKYLLLKHCFETLGCIRVQLKTDLRNRNSQRAIIRIGGVQEGILRNHMIIQDGYVRDTVFFSIVQSEWAGVKEKLIHILGQNTRI
ncbi:GNAT family N-acetyltransferase [Brevibacillus ginsengisoli]|uniref:GNAT family N-acetyltransferase n=1 Tax=Brevibacillus ginsengisoli TaxID=363854 RepID=UPI003CF08584